MASVTPIKLDGTNLREIASANGDTIRDRLVYLYLTDPSVTLAIVANSGSLDAINDTRMQAGAMSTSNTAFPNEATTAEPSTVTVAFDKINESVTTLSQPADTNNIRFPVYLDGTNIKSMSYQDCFDTWVNSATNAIIAALPYQIGTSTTPPSGYTNVSTTPVFIDTRADTSLYTAAGLDSDGEDLDQPQTITNYYLHKSNGTAVTVTGMPLYIDSNQNLKEYTVAELDVVLKEIIRYTVATVAGQKIRYFIDGSGTTLGSGMANTKLNGAGNYQTRQDGDDYRAQEFPNGSVVTEATYYLKARKV